MSRVIHWLTAALVVGLSVTAIFGGIDPRGAGNAAFLWHSSLGILVYLLSICRALLWLVHRVQANPAGARADDRVGRVLHILFYVLLLALPISGWLLASEQGSAAHLLGLPALPQWYSSAISPTTGSTPAIAALHRIHAALATALLGVVVLHGVLLLRDRVRTT